MSERAASGEPCVKKLLLAAGCLLLASVSRAAKTCSPEADYMVSRAAECMEHEDAGCAKLKLDPILEKEPNCAGALFIRGWIYQYYDGKVETGRAMQEKAMELDPTFAKFWEERVHAI